MPTDIVLGAIMLAMAILGGVVSAHAPAKLWQKAAYAIAFVVMGMVGMYFVVTQSKETALSSAKLAGSIAALERSSVEIERSGAEMARIQSLNTKLQERLLSQSAAIASLGKETVSQITGEGTYVYFNVVPNAGSGSPVSFPISMWIRGKYPMREVTSTIQRSATFSLSRNLMPPTLPVPKTLLPGVSPVEYRLELGQYSIQTWCAAGGPINEVIRLTMVNGNLDQQVEVWGWGKRLYKSGSEDLGFAKPMQTSR